MTHRACDVCVINSGDRSPKAVEWCAVCGKWKCAQCRGSVTRSVKAIVRQSLRKLAPNDHKKTGRDEDGSSDRAAS